MTKIRTYDPKNSAIFRKVRDPFGEFSNMAPGFPLTVNNLIAKTSEALYQALKFPLNPDIQAQILKENSPMAAKMKSRSNDFLKRKDWMEIRVKAMRWVIEVKALQHPRFTALLQETENRPIVEHSERDQFWGANEGEDGLFHGVNALGRLLMELREKGNLIHVEPLPIEAFLLNGVPIPTLTK